MNRDTTFTGIIAVGVLIVALLSSSVIVNYVSVDHVTATVHREPERECRTSGSDGSVSTECSWKIYTENEVFEDVDNMWFFKFNSADIANRIRNGETYCFKVNGYRLPFLSWFRNIITVKPGACPT
jgi:hypothetical protein